MVLTFVNTFEIGDGHSPALLHLADNEVVIIYLDPAGDMKTIEADVPLGDWESMVAADFGAPQSALSSRAVDTGIEKIISKRITRGKSYLGWLYGGKYARNAMYPFSYNPSPITHSGQTGRMRPV